MNNDDRSQETSSLAATPTEEMVLFLLSLLSDTHISGDRESLLFFGSCDESFIDLNK